MFNLVCKDTDAETIISGSSFTKDDDGNIII